MWQLFNLSTRMQKLVNTKNFIKVRLYTKITLVLLIRLKLQNHKITRKIIKQHEKYDVTSVFFLLF